MPDVISQPKTNDEVLQLLDARRKETSQDAFHVRIERKGPDGLPEILTNCQAELDQLTRVEDWLPALFGAGTYYLHCYHLSDTTHAVGRLLLVFKSPRLNGPNWPVLEGPAWNGPKIRPPSAPEQVAQTYADPGAGDPFRRATATGYPGSSVVPTAVAPDPTIGRLLETFQRQEAARDRQLAESRADMNRLLDRVMQPTPTQKSMFESPEVIAAVGGLVAKFFESSAANRLEQQRILAEQQKETRELIRAFSAPKALDPVLENLLKETRAENRKLMERFMDSTQTPDPAEQMAPMMRSFGETMSFMIKAINALAAQRLGNEGSGFGEKLADVAEKAIGLIATRAGGRPGPQPVAGQRPPAPPQPAAPQLPASSLDQLRAAVYGYMNPQELATAIVGALQAQDPQLMQALAKHDGNLNALAVEILGEAWLRQAPKNQVYLNGLLEEVDRQATAVGLGVEEVDGDQSEATAGEAAKPAASAPKIVDFTERVPAAPSA